MTRTNVYLLDSNVLIALATPEHTLNQRAAAWFREGHVFATCPVTQGALFRFHLRSGIGATAQSARGLIQAICSMPRHVFWPDEASYLDLPLKGIMGYRQVTDAYLVLLARQREGRLATLDRALAAIHPEAVLIS